LKQSWKALSGPQKGCFVRPSVWPEWQRSFGLSIVRFSRGNRKKSQSVKSGEYVARGNTVI